MKNKVIERPKRPKNDDVSNYIEYVRKLEEYIAYLEIRILELEQKQQQ